MRRVHLSKFAEDVRQAAINAAVDVEGDVVTLSHGDYLRLRAAGVKPGDAVARMTKAVGIKPCGGCRKRQAALNELPKRLIKD